MGRVRVSGGLFRGRWLPVGPGVRPTEGRVREALFSMLGAELDGARFLDLFSGSGAVGIEAVGRGAASALLIESDPGTIRALKRSIGELQCGSQVEVRRMELPHGLRRLDPGLEFDIVFADPPYRFTRYAELLTGILPWLGEGSLLVVEHAADQAFVLPVDPGWSLVDQRRYGECGLTFVRRTETTGSREGHEVTEVDPPEGSTSSG